MLVDVTRSEIGSCFLFFVVNGAVIVFSNIIFSLVWLELLVVVAHGFEFKVSSWRFLVAGRGGMFRKIYDCLCRSGTLK